VGRSRAAVLVQGDGHLGNFQALKGAFNGHFRGEFHAGGLQLHFIIGRFCEAAQARMKIMRGTFEKYPANGREHGVADPAVFPGHGPRHDPAATGGEPAAHHQFIARLETFHKPVHLGKIITVIGIAHDDPFAPGGLDAAAQGVPITLGGDGHHARPELFRNRLGAIRAAVVCDEDFPRHARAHEPLFGLLNTAGNRFGLIETGH